MGCHPILLAVASVLVLGCSASISEATGGDGDGEHALDARPPLPGPEHPGNGPGAVMAVSRLFFGDVDRAGRRDPDAWRSLGFDIDGENTSCDGSACEHLAHCGALEAAPPGVFDDGNDGIDNSFGAHLVDQIVLGLGADFWQQTADDLGRGEFTLLFAIDELGADHDYNPLVARFYRGANLGHAPTFDGNDAWPVTDDSLSDAGDMASSRSMFGASWVTANRWVSGYGEVTLHLPFLGSRLDLPIHHAIVTMDLSKDRTSATHGTISGVLHPDELVRQVPRLAGSVDPSLCDSDGVHGVQTEVRRAADILSSGHVGTPDVPCDGISIGLGFEARRVLLGAVTTEPPPPDACSD